MSAPLNTFNALFLTSSREDPDVRPCERGGTTLYAASSPVADIEFEASDFDVDEARIFEVLFEMLSRDIDVHIGDPFIEIPIELAISENTDRYYSTDGSILRNVSFCDETMSLEFSTLSPARSRFENSINL
jgi:hypothetical protein